ncbi:MAG: tRNA (N6-isopentenyl adenosine(37)-C2)-methylthiotransferase MiaB [Bdellovibrionales bacterium]|nr:tRNA (N6-isopentenyl adenosine(37)-C2)-methylthiotransferase MiaB [Bdellovibrionales bacterium]
MSDAVTPTPASPSTKQKVLIKTFGCQMNVADTERMIALMEEKGMEPTQDAKEANLIIINGCSVREKAVHKAVSFLGEQQIQKKQAGGKGPIIALGGCVGQLDKGELFKRAPYLDFVFGPDAIDQLPELVHRAEIGHKHFVQVTFDKTLAYSTQTKVQGSKAAAFVNIMKGCDKYCTYCIVPFTRGREKSRTIQEVLGDVAALVAKGVREVTLLGQNVNSFGKGNANTQGYQPQELHNQIGKVGPRSGEENFPQLLYAMETDPRLAKLKRIRYTSSHPLDFSDELIECYSKLTKLAKHLHLPVQHGSDRVLAKMGRHHKIDGYIAQMNELKRLNPDVGLSTDLIVGFPTETEEDFQETLRLLDQVEYDNIYAFAYSPRPGTRAAKMVDDVPNDVKNERLNRLLKYQLVIAERRYKSRVGQTMEVLVEGFSKNQNLLQSTAGGTAEKPAAGRVWNGRTTCNRPVNFVDTSNRNLLGQFLQVKIIAATSLSLTGELIHDASFAESKSGDEGVKYTSSYTQSEVVQ